MKRTWHFAAVIILIAAGGLALRLPRLAQRPMHGDEAVHAVKFDTLWRTGQYVYDPQEYHGPVLYYATLPAMWLSGARSFAETSETTFRIVPVVFGIGLIRLSPLVASGLGRGAVLVAGVLTALSPALSFYARYYIQETLLAFFAFAVIACGWRYVRTRRAYWAILAGACVGLMHATKETYLISFGCMLAAAAGTLVWRSVDAARRRWRVGDIVVAAVIAVAISAAFYSGFGSNPRGVWDSLCSYGTYFERAGGSGLHDHPWAYYLHMLLFTHLGPGPWWSEALILVLAALGIVAALTGRGLGDADRALVRFLALYALLMTLVYSTIPYKTPWCLLQFLQPLTLLAGVGTVALLRWLRLLPLRLAAGGVLLAATVHLGWQAGQANFRFYVDYRNPYVYAHPLSGVVRLADWVEKLARFHPDRQRMLVKVIAEDPWPLPWYLRRLERVGYWEQPPEDPDAPVVIVSHTRAATLPARFADEQRYQTSSYGLRPDVRLLVYADRALYERFAVSIESLP